MLRRPLFRLEDRKTGWPSDLHLHVIRNQLHQVARDERLRKST